VHSRWFFRRPDRPAPMAESVCEFLIQIDCLRIVLIHAVGVEGGEGLSIVGSAG
jgi:hypothetical protein